MGGLFVYGICKALPPGTKRQHKDGLYEKQSDGTWKKVTEGKPREKKEDKNTKNIVKQFEQKWERQGVKTDIYYDSKNNRIELSAIVIDKKQRGKGIGTIFMNEMIAMADSNKSVITLTPSTDYGASSKKRLIEFYQRFGFVENKGKNRNLEISDDMYRLPVKE